MPQIIPFDVPITAGSGTNVSVDQIKDSAGNITNVQYMKLLDALSGSGFGLTVNPDGSINVTQAAPFAEDLRMVGSQPLSLGRTDASNAIPVVLASDQTPVPVVSDAGTIAQPIIVNPSPNANTQPITGNVTAAQLGNWLISLIQNGLALAAANPLPVQLSDGVASYDFSTLLRMQRSLLELEAIRTNQLMLQTSLFIPQTETLPFLGA